MDLLRLVEAVGARNYVRRSFSKLVDAQREEDPNPGSSDLGPSMRHSHEATLLYFSITYHAEIFTEMLQVLILRTGSSKSGFHRNEITHDPQLSECIVCLCWNMKSVKLGVDWYLFCNNKICVKNSCNDAGFLIS